MNTIIPRIIYPELVLGFVAPIGADQNGVVSAFSSYFKAVGYKVVDIKVTDIYDSLAKYVVPNPPLEATPPEERYKSYIKYGDQLRGAFDDDSFLAMTAVARIVEKRDQSDQFSKTVYLLRQFKRHEEIDLLRSVYGDIFFQISTYSRRGSRVDTLARKFAEGHDNANINGYRPEAEDLVRIDEDETDDVHGQEVGKIFHMADFIVNLDEEMEIPAQVNRFCELLFSSNEISPSKMEHGMHLAQSAALRSLDLSRQVGACILDSNGQIVCLGANEVPKAGGGTYWADGEYDDRDYKRGRDTNEQRKREILSELLGLIGHDKGVDEVLKEPKVKNSQLMDALEYGRMIHAEMNAICDAARLGRSCSGAILYVTTFPCHICAKHLVATGLDKVVFLEPYPKSLALRLNNDSIQIEGGERGGYSKYPSVKFVHFFGVTPRRYQEMFQRGRRKSRDGKGTFQRYEGGMKHPLIDIKAPSYTTSEKAVLEKLKEKYASKGILQRA